MAALICRHLSFLETKVGPSLFNNPRLAQHSVTRLFSSKTSSSSSCGEDLVSQLEDILGLDGSVTTAAAVREAHGRDESYHADVDGLFAPDVVTFPKSSEEVAEIVKACTERKIPVQATGTLTSLEGHTAFLRGGVAIDMTQMNQIISVDQEDMDCRVQAGVTRKQLNDYLRYDYFLHPIGNTHSTNSCSHSFCLFPLSFGFPTMT